MFQFDRSSSRAKLFSILMAPALALALVASASSQEAAPEPPSREARIQELLEITGSGDIGLQVMATMMDQLRPAMPEVPDEWWGAFMAKVDPDDLESLVVPVYAKHFTDEEIDAMLAFYRTSVGQSVIAKMPAVMQESMVIGNAWGRGLAMELFKHLEADGYSPPDMPGVPRMPEAPPSPE